MRRVAGLVLSALGAFLIVLALLTRFVVVGEAVKFPLNEKSISTLTASNASYFSPSKLHELTGVTLQDTVTVEGDNASGNTSRAVWNEFSYVYDKTNRLTYDYSTERLAFDRRTGELINCCGAAIGTNSSVHLSGQGFVWPIGAQQQTYQYFDTTLLKPEPAAYAGTAVVDGLTTYKYTETVLGDKSGTQTLPGSLVNDPTAQSVTLNEYDQATTTFYVDPASGAPVKEVSDEHLYLQNGGAEALDLLKANFVTAPSSIAAAVSNAKSKDSEIELVTVILPVVFALVGLILLVMGIILTVSVREEPEYDDGYADEYEPGGIPA
jgi:Porin PorA